MPIEAIRGPQGLPGRDGRAGPHGPEGRPGQDGKDGRDGKDGKEAVYAMAVLRGFKGTEDDWLRSLVGKDGLAGKDGLNGKDGAAGARGPKGEPGKDGADGRDGKDGRDGIDGRTLLSGSGAPNANLGALGDFYIDIDKWRIYGPKRDNGWGPGVDLKGKVVMGGGPDPIGSGGGGTWGGIIGTVSDQTDLVAYVQAQIDALIDSAPATLDTLNELAAALADDANFASTMTAALAGKEATANKNASGGYAGLTLFKLNLRNAANTITSWFTTAATVARTWTLPDKDGTVAMTDDVITAHSGLSGVGSNTHAQIDTHIASTANPHSVTKAQVGLTSVTDDAQTKAAVMPNTAPAAGRIPVGNAGGTAYAPVAVSGDITLDSAGVATLAARSTGDIGAASTTLVPSQSAVVAYVASYLAGFDAKPEVAYASTSALPANTYSNGSSGVGATLTGNVNGPLLIDGVTLAAGAVGMGVLVAGESTAANNGWYTLTQLGVIAVSPYILTRDTRSDQAAEIASGFLTAVSAPTGLSAGSANNGKLFMSACPSLFTVGTSALAFTAVGTTYTADESTLHLSGTQFSVKDKGITLAKQDDMATASVFYRKTAGTGAPEVQTLATLKTDLGLTGTNSGDVTSTVNHGSTAGTARPTNAGPTLWVGSVEPSNAVDGDVWIATA